LLPPAPALPCDAPPAPAAPPPDTPAAPVRAPAIPALLAPPEPPAETFPPEPAVSACDPAAFVPAVFAGGVSSSFQEHEAIATTLTDSKPKLSRRHMAAKHKHLSRARQA
jgi:hypothetical protein